MPRKRLVRDDFNPYHVTVRANNKEHFPIDLTVLWRIFGSECFNHTVRSGTEFHALVLMPNHLHMMLTVPEGDLGKVTNEIFSYVTKSVNKYSGRSGHLFGGPYHWSLIQNARYFGHALKYVYRNPVKAKLCEKVEDYEFSTLNGLIGQSQLHFPIYYSRAGYQPDIPWDNYVKFQEWLNKPFANEIENEIQRKLRKRLFGDFVRDADRRKMLEFESLL